MTTPKEETGIVPVMLTAEEAAALLGMSLNTFRRRRPLMEGSGFPPPDALFKRYYIRAILTWLDRRHGIEPKMQIEKGPTVADQIGLENWDGIDTG